MQTSPLLPVGPALWFPGWRASRRRRGALAGAGGGGHFGKKTGKRDVWWIRRGCVPQLGSRLRRGGGWGDESQRGRPHLPALALPYPSPTALPSEILPCSAASSARPCLGTRAAQNSGSRAAWTPQERGQDSTATATVRAASFRRLSLVLRGFQNFAHLYALFQNNER